MARLNIKGQSLIELIIAIAIGMILMGTATTAVVLILKVNSDTRATQTAVSLEQEYLDSISTVSKSDWNNIYGLNKGTNNLYSIKNLYLFQISGGAWHTCGVKTDGTVYCWGDNSFGQLGDNTTIQRLVPVQVKGVGGVGYLTNVVQITAGNYYTCAIKTDGSAYCWGDNNFAQLGDNTTTQRLTPVQVKGVGGVGYLTDVIQITTDDHHTCAIKNDGSAYCWGSNGVGQLGDNTTIQRLVPVQVKGVGGVGYLTNVVQITAGDHYTCAIKTDGSAYCWGENSFGKLGDNTTIQRLVPVQVKGVDDVDYLTNIIQINAGYYHTCAIKNDGSAYCWGRNDFGQLGDNTTIQRLVPVQVKGVGGVGYLTNIIQIADSYLHTCAIKNDGSAYCWGDNSFGKLGDNTTIQRLVPVQVKGVGGVGYLTNVVQVAANYLHNCAIKTDGSAYCWGRNSSGQLGDNTTVNKWTPVQVLGVGASGYLYLNSDAFIRKIMSGLENLVIDGRNFTRYFFIENVNRTSCGVGNITLSGIQNCPNNFPGGAGDIYEDPSTQKITIKTEWRNQSIFKTQYLTRHRNLIYRQTDWSGGSGQIYFPTSTIGTQVNDKFDTSTNINNYASSGLIKQLSILTTGYATSSVFDSIKASTTINSIMWWGALNGGNVSFQLASSNNNNGPWNFMGPDGSASTYYTAGSGIPIKVNLAYHNNQRYFKYIILISGGSGPVVDDVIINWSP